MYTHVNTVVCLVSFAYIKKHNGHAVTMGSAGTSIAGKDD